MKLPIPEISDLLKFDSDYGRLYLDLGEYLLPPHRSTLNAHAAMDLLYVYYTDPNLIDHHQHDGLR